MRPHNSISLLPFLTTLARAKSLILWGDTRLGKTLWARDQGSHFYNAGMFNLDEYQPETTYAVFDDMMGGLGNFSAYKQWLGAQIEFTVTDKYKKKQRILWNWRPTIWVANVDPATENVDQNWLQGNCTIVHITTQIARVDEWPETP